MNDSPPRHRSAATDEPVLTRLEPPTGGRGLGWRVAAGAFVIVLLALIGLGRLGMEESRPPPAGSPVLSGPSPAPVARSSPTPSSPPDSTTRPTSRPASNADPRTPGTPPPAVDAAPVDAAPEVARHLDGIPTSLGGEKVYRVTSALARSGAQPILVGGWYLGPQCALLRHVGACPNARMSDDPAGVGVPRRSVRLTGRIELGSGPRVVRATVSAGCPTGEREARCSPTLDVREVVWRGDLFSLTGPIEVLPLLGAMQFAFPDMRAEPFRDLARCPVVWPPQTYRSITGGPRMTVIFPTLEDRIEVEQAVRGNWPQPASHPGAQCLDQFMDAGKPAGWIAEHNVMVWVNQDPASVALARAAILDARSQSAAHTDPAPHPFTTWAALRALQRWEADLKVRPPHDVLIWGPGLDVPAGEQAAAEAYALSDPLIRLLLVFPDSAARRGYQAETNSADVLVLRGRPPSQEALAAGLTEARKAGVRWLGLRNVLLQVGGAQGFDQQLRRFLRREIR